MINEHTYGIFRAGRGDVYRISLGMMETGKEEEPPAYRFRKEGGEVKLLKYRKELALIENRPTGPKVLRPIPIGSPLAEYSYKDYMALEGASLEKLDEKNTGFGQEEPFIASSDTFDDLMENTEEGRDIYIEPQKQQE